MLTSSKTQGQIQNIENVLVPPYPILLQNDYESLWIEIQNDSGHNTICGVFCRHPLGNLDNFLNHLNMIVDKIHCEKKYCVLLGDFNLDLLKFESHPSTENVLNTLGSYYFQPQILQPTRTIFSLILLSTFPSMEIYVMTYLTIYQIFLS